MNFCSLAADESRNRLLFIAPFPPPTTGQSIACQALFNDLVKCELDVCVVNSSKQSFKSGANSLGRLGEVVWSFSKIIAARQGAQIIYFNVSESIAGNIKDLLIFVCLLGHLDRTFIHLHGGAGMRLLLSSKHPLICFVNGIFLKRLGGVIVLGERLSSIYIKHIPQKRIHVVKNFAPDESFIDRVKLRQKLENENVPLRILFLSNLLSTKGYLDLKAAVNLLPQNVIQGIEVNFAGGFESEADETCFLEDIRDLPQVHYHGTVHGREKKQLLMDSHVFCLPTFYQFEGQPISILEAYAAGCAVLTTNHSGIFDIFEPGRNGLEVAKRKPESIAAAIIELFFHRHMLRKFCILNAREARREYRSQKHLSQIRSVLNL